MKKLLLTILLTMTTTLAGYGTVDMTRYTSLLEKIARDYRPYADAYNDTARATHYVFDFPEVSYFPYECAGLSKDSLGQVVYAYPYGGVMRTRTDESDTEHVAVATIRFVSFRDEVAVRYFEMRFYKAGPGGAWKEERKAVKVDQYKNGECK